jgi:hypothetical protein
VAFRKTNASLISHQIAVIELRNREPERAAEKYLPCSRLEQICSTHNFRDTHGSIVHNDGELVSRHVIAPPHDKVAEVTPGNQALRPKVQIAEANLFSIGNAKPPMKSDR